MIMTIDDGGEPSTISRVVSSEAGASATHRQKPKDI